jgi:pimeloyl-ACP methyl ester carboxylesterase
LSDAALLASVREENGDLVPRVTPEVYAGGFHGFQIESTRDLFGALSESGTPILLLLAGQSKGDAHEADVAAFREALPRAEIRDFPEAGHNVLLDDPDEAIPAIADWLEHHAK